MCFFLCLFCMFHRRYSNCRPLNSARYNRIICQTVENTSFFERLSCIIARVGERLPRLQIQFLISRSFRPRNLVNLGSKIRFWIRRKEHTLCIGWGSERTARYIQKGCTVLLAFIFIISGGEKISNASGQQGAANKV